MCNFENNFFYVHLMVDVVYNNEYIHEINSILNRMCGFNFYIIFKEMVAIKKNSDFHRL